MKLNFKLHIKEKISKAMKGICIIKKLSNLLLRKSFITIYKSFLRLHLDYGDLIMINQIMKTSVNKLKVFNIVLPLESLVLLKQHPDLNLYNEIGLESLKFRRWLGKLCAFYKIKSTGLHSYLYDLIPNSSHMYNNRSVEDVAMLYSRTDIFYYSFFPSTISEWNKLDLKAWQSFDFPIYSDKNWEPQSSQ